MPYAIENNIPIFLGIEELKMEPTFSELPYVAKHLKDQKPIE